MRHKAQSVSDEKNKVLRKKREANKGKKQSERNKPKEQMLQSDMATLQQGLGNKTVARLVDPNHEREQQGNGEISSSDSFESILARPTGGQTPHLQRDEHELNPRQITVAPAHHALGDAANSAAAGPVSSANPNVANQQDLETIRAMNPNFAAAEQSAGRWNKAADAIGASAPVIAGIITVATGGAGAPAAQIVNVVAKGLTILCKEMEKQGLIGEIDALIRMLPYVAPDDKGQYQVWKKRIQEYEGKIARAEVKEVKALLSLFEPPMIVGAAEFAGSLAYKKQIEGETKKAAQNLDKGRILEWMKDRDIQKRQQQGEFVPLDEMISQEDRHMPVSSGHGPSTWQKLKGKLTGKGKKVSPF